MVVDVVVAPIEGCVIADVTQRLSQGWLVLRGRAGGGSGVSRDESARAGLVES